jgi:hypothetical protein
MADDSDEEQTGEEELKEEEAVPEKPKKLFINHIDSYHGKNIARVSVYEINFIIKIRIFIFSKIFARAKPSATGEAVEEEETLEEEHGEDRQKQLYDEHPIENGWKVSGTIQNSQGYKRPAFIQEVIQV